MYKKMFVDFEIEVSDALFETFTGEATLAICQKICEICAYESYQ